MGIYDAGFAQKRRHIRFNPDPLDHALIAVGDGLDGFRPTMVAMILEESPMGGCGLAMAISPDLKPGVKVRAKVGKLAPLLAEVVWVRVLDDRVMRVGLRYLE